MIVIARKWGLLCNRLFTMAHAIAAAIEYDTVVLNPAFTDYAKHFVATKDDPLCRFPARSSVPLIDGCIGGLLRTPGAHISGLIPRLHLSTRIARTIPIGWNGQCRLDSSESAKHIRQTWLLFLDGWAFTAPDLFDRHTPAIREFFTPLPNLAARAEEAANLARGACDVLVGVHIRQGDYKTHLGGKYFYETARYFRMMQEIADSFPNKQVGFLVCSNVQQDATAFGDLQWRPGDGHLIADLYSLALCDYVMGPPSTFSQWASFYGQVPLGVVHYAEQPVSHELFQVFSGHSSHK